MLTFSINEVNPVHMLKVQQTIENNIQYFKKFNGARWQEAANKAFEMAVSHVKEEYEVLDPYIKNIARNILKVQEKESPVDTITEDGEVSYPFLKLSTYLDDSNLTFDKNEVLDTFKELYLLYGDDFLKLKLLFKKTDDKFSKAEIIKNDKIQEAFLNLRTKYDSRNIYDTLYDFFKRLPDYSREIENATLKIIDMKSKDMEFLDFIPDIPLIRDKEGRFYGIDKINLTMERDPDTFEWDVITPTTCDIVRIDISPLMNYMYGQVYVPQGCFTKHTFWCDNMYRLTTPGGKTVVNMDRDKFINMVRIELISHLVNNRINTIIAISPDYIYVKPARMIGYDTVRLMLCTGKMIDLPIEIYLKKRKL